MNDRRLVFFGLSRRAARGDLAFTPLRPGIEIHRLYGTGTDPEEPAAAVLRYAPGASLPYHVHPGHEHIYILDGAQVDERGVYGPGTLVVNPPGSGHTVSSPRGCLALLLWEKPVVYV
jgi:anti-sigma factor ChrR (cupin superfamily)